jgi:hypothetical protein
MEKIMILKTDDTITKTEGEISYKSITNALDGGWMAIHPTGVDGIYMYVDDQGIRKELPLNKNATILYNVNTSAPFHPVQGNAILFRNINGDTMSLTEEQEDRVSKIIGTIGDSK